MSDHQRESQELAASDEWHKQWDLVSKATEESLAKMMVSPAQRAWHRAWSLMCELADEARADAASRKPNQAQNPGHEPTSPGESLTHES